MVRVRVRFEIMAAGAVAVACACALAAGQLRRLYATLLYFIWRDVVPPRHPWATQCMVSILILCAYDHAGQSR